MDKLEKNINYKFKNRAYLMEALTHSSFANEQHDRAVNAKSNERLEFLGDAVVSIVSAKFLFEKFPDMNEGDLSRLRSSLVCTTSLSEFARKIHLGDFLFLGKGEINTGGADRDSILENAFEALTAAIYLDGGLESAREFVLSFLAPAVETHHINFKDYKTKLQEIIQENPGENVYYVITGTKGPDHNKLFEAEVRLNHNVIGKGEGRSKKSAEQAAAKEALRLMGIE
ncbi:MAG: ribonuclease III [Eubacteriales bacterium]|nr:ribonuclease III [Eubacteriales bacterium]